MDLNLDALSNAIIEEYRKRTGNEKLVEDFIASVGAKGTYSDVYALAKKSGLNLEQAIINQWTFDSDEVYFSSMKELLERTTGPMHDDIAKACQFIQDKMNKAAGIKLKSQLAAVNDYDLGDIADRMKNQGITKLFGELQTLGCKMVDDNQQANMDLQTSAGYNIVMSREYDDVGLRKGTKYAEECKWCKAKAKTANFKSTREARASGMFGRHPGCMCRIEYESKRTGVVNRDVQNYKTAVIPKQSSFGESRKGDVQENLVRIEIEDKKKKIADKLKVAASNVSIPAKEIDTNNLKYDENHVINERERSISREEAVSWIKEAAFSVNVWDGKFERFFSEKGAAYVNLTSNEIRTAYSREQYTSNIEEVITRFFGNGS